MNHSGPAGFLPLLLLLFENLFWSPEVLRSPFKDDHDGGGGRNANNNEGICNSSCTEISLYDNNNNKYIMGLYNIWEGVCT